jgi:hypothetical protein
MNHGYDGRVGDGSFWEPLWVYGQKNRPPHMRTPVSFTLRCVAFRA